MTTMTAAPPCLRVDTSLKLPRIPLERAESQPSLSHSASTTVSEEPPASLGSLLSPLDRESSAESHPKKPMSKFRSMTNLRNREKKDLKTKTSTPFLKSPISPPLPSSNSTSAPMAIPARPTARRSGSSFSSFIRRLTGRATSPPRSKPHPQPQLQPQPPSQRAQATSVRTQPASAQSLDKSMSASINTQAARPPQAHSAHLSPSMPTKPLSATMVVSGTATSAPTSTYQPPSPCEADPLSIPLPPSPTLSPVDDDAGPPVALSLAPVPSPVLGSAPTPAHRPAAAPAPAAAAAPALAPPVHLVSVPPPRRAKPIGMLSLEGFELQEELDDDDFRPPHQSGAERSNEAADVVRPLAPIRIPNGGGASSTSAADSGNLATPTTDNEGVGRSPTSNANLLRKESRFRKSMMGLSDHVGKRSAPRPPPTSYESYDAQQRRAAANRQSCAPTMHSRASVMRELYEVKDKNEADMAETFFLS